jgi:hypothetical protein
MATRKKKTDTANQPAGGWPRITEGSHLRIVEHENGRRELQWDDEALMRDVRAAIASVESVASTETAKTKRTRSTTKK